eukprot:Nk52_evm23s2273 gene=Nk52_evmTU23s2273
MGNSLGKLGKKRFDKRPSDTAAEMREIENNGGLRPQKSFRDNLAELASQSAELQRQESNLSLNNINRHHTAAGDKGGTTNNEVDEKLLLNISFRSIRFGCGSVIDEEYPCNRIKTTKYTRYNFLAKNLYEQFKRIANVYFLFLAVLNTIPAVQTFSPILGFVPVIFVLGVTAVKDMWEDYRRYRSDKATNNRPCQMYNLDTNSFEEVTWKELYAGHIVKLERDEVIPGDVIVLGTSNEDGICYVETMNLDGETNLKQRFVPTGVKVPDVSVFQELDGRIDCDMPNSKIYNFSGCMVFDGEDDIPLDSRHLLLRGTNLRNTDWVVGVVVYAGSDTKAVQNNTGVRFKRSKAESDINSKLYLMCATLVTLAAIGAICSYVFLNDKWGTRATYLAPDSDSYTPSLQAFLDFWTLVIIFQYVIPISLYVTIEMIKLGQIYFILSDVEMYDEAKDQPIEVRALNIPEDLGQIHYCFSDKTGTLTENKMDFKMCSIHGRLYDHPESEDEFVEEHDFVKDGQLSKALEAHSSFEHEFMCALALCNTSVPSSKEGVLFDSESPDEAALVKTAYLYGYQLESRSTEKMCVSICEKLREYKVLAILPFDSTRKRMSVLVEDDAGNVTLFCKGADNAMLDVLHGGQERIIENTKEHLHGFSVSGLRTLVIGKADISREFLAKWMPEYHAASSLLDNREEALESLTVQMESRITLLGATGIEDKLQEGVPESIRSLRRAGIKVWVLTGDKQETAVNIARDCKLFYDGMEIVVLEASSNDEYNEEIDKLYKKICLDNDEGKEYGLVVNGSVIAYALEEVNQVAFADIACACVSVLVCRSTPSQKARIVKLVRDHKDMMTLAIGDGANDVGMIQTANIGIGIAGVEGMQAKMASDFAIGQFRFLVRLLLVHGHWCYDRLAYMLLYFFYKNFTMVMVNFWFQLYCAFSAQTALDALFLQSYNLCWTALPPIVLGIFDQNISDRTLMRQPELYRISRFGKIFTLRRFWLTMFHAMYQSICIFFVAYATYRDSDVGLYRLGVTIQASIVICVNLTIAMEFRRWNWMVHFVIWMTIFVYFCYQLAVNAMLPNFSGNSFAGYWAMEMAVQTGTFWFSVMMAVILAMAPAFVYKFTRHFYFPHEFDFLREQEKIGRHERRKERRKQKKIEKRMAKEEIGNGDDDEMGTEPVSDPDNKKDTDAIVNRTASNLV